MTMWARVARLTAGGVALLGASFGPTARAAELRVDFAELARPVQTIVGNASIHLNNKPGGFLMTGPSSYITLNGQQIALPIPAKSFDLFGSTYAYYVNSIDSTSIRVIPVAGALRLTVTFKTSGPALESGCISGGCGLQGGLPVINWTKPSFSIDVTPVSYKGSLSLRAQQVSIGGSLDPVCTSTGFFQSSECDLSLNYARSTIRTLRSDLAKSLIDQINSDGLQAAIAAALKPYLKLGTIGDIAIDSVTSSPTGLVIRFKLAS